MEENNQTTIIGIYDEEHSKSGPILMTKNGVVHLINFQPDSKYQGKTLEVTGNLYKDKEHIARPYKKGELTLQGWALPRTVMKVISIKVIK